MSHSTLHCTTLHYTHYTTLHSLHYTTPHCVPPITSNCFFSTTSVLRASSNSRRCMFVMGEKLPHATSTSRGSPLEGGCVRVCVCVCVCVDEMGYKITLNPLTTTLHCTTLHYTPSHPPVVWQPAPMRFSDCPMGLRGRSLSFSPPAWVGCGCSSAWVAGLACVRQYPRAEP
jgi:hypothetical protein